MELVKSLYEDEWAFRDPLFPEDIESKFDQALDACDDGRCKRAETLTGLVVVECPNHIDALHRLGLYREDHGDVLGGHVFRQAAVAIGLQAIPTNPSQN